MLTNRRTLKICDGSLRHSSEEKNHTLKGCKCSLRFLASEKAEPVQAEWLLNRPDHGHGPAKKVAHVKTDTQTNAESMHALQGQSLPCIAGGHNAVVQLCQDRCEIRARRRERTKRIAAKLKSQQKTFERAGLHAMGVIPMPPATRAR
jgi:hypothetical protein